MSAVRRDLCRQGSLQQAAHADALGGVEAVGGFVRAECSELGTHFVVAHHGETVLGVVGRVPGDGGERGECDRCSLVIFGPVTDVLDRKSVV